MPFVLINSALVLNATFYILFTPYMAWKFMVATPYRSPVIYKTVKSKDTQFGGYVDKTARALSIAGMYSTVYAQHYTHRFA